MEKFKVQNDAERISSINRTIRISSENFDKLMELSNKSGLSFNKVVNQCIEYALKNLSDD